MADTTVSTFCRMCPAVCGVVVTVDADGRVVRLTGDRADPVSNGYLCPKGRRMATFPDDPARLDRPLLRDGRGRLVPVDWDTALDDLAGRLARVQDEQDAYAIGLYAGTMYDTAGRWAAGRLMHALGSPSTYTSLTLDAVSKVFVSRLMAGKERIWPNTDFDATTLLVILGENVVVSHGGYSYVPDPITHLRAVTRRGEVWVLDPRRTETAKHATHHLAPRSGSDYAVLAFLVRGVLEDGADHEYLAAHARNVDALRGAVAPFDLDTTVARTGLAAEALDALLAAVRRHRRLAVVTGTGVSMAATGTVADWLGMALQIVTGSYERPGGRWFNHGATFDPAQPVACESAELADSGPRTRPEIRRVAGQYPSALLPGEIEAGHVRALLVTGGNPMTAFPQPERLGAALDRLDVLAVWDVVSTATTERATHVFPCPDGLERADLKIPIHIPAVYAQYSPAAVPRRGERRSMWWSLAELGRRLGVDVLPDGADPRECTDDDVLAMQVAGTPVDFDALRSAGGPVAFPRVDNWVVDHVLPDGRWDVAPDVLVTALARADGQPRHELSLGNRREIHHTNSLFTWAADGHPTLEGCVMASPEDAARFGLIDGQAVEVASAHGAFRGTLRIDAGVAAGTVIVPHGFSDPNVGSVTATDVDLDPLTGMPALVGVGVTLRAAPVPV